MMVPPTRTNRFIRSLQLMIVDGFSIGITYGLVVIIFHFLDLSQHYDYIIMFLPFVIVWKLVFFFVFGLYRMLLDHFTFEDAVKIVMLVLSSNLLLAAFFGITQVPFIPWILFAFIAPIELALVTAPRISKRVFLYFRTNTDWRNSLGIRTLIVGAGNAGEMVIKEIYRNNRLANIPIGVIDDDPSKIGNELSGIKIYGPIDRILDVVSILRIEEVIIAISALDYKRLQSLVQLLTERNIKVKRLPLASEMKSGADIKIIDVKVEDLLNRDVVTLDNDELESFIKGETVLVTGGGGSIGSELCRQIAKFSPKQLIIFDIYENNAYEVQMELEYASRKKKNPLDLKVLIGSVYNPARLEDIYKNYQPTRVFHAAAYKHVPLMEDSPQEAVRTNIIGTYNAAKLAADYHVKSFLLVSSDKAVRPTNIMGATKRYAEIVIQYFAQNHPKTRYAAVRFGNVLGSNGSVIPLFKRQIEAGGPLTVTHKSITRYFMTIPESVGLILQAAVYAHGGEIFVLDMGEPVKIFDLAEKMIKLAGLKPNRDIDIIITGLRPGEKLYEELLVDKETAIETDNHKIFIETNICNCGHAFSLDEYQKLTGSFETLDGKILKETLLAIIENHDNCQEEGKKV